MFSSKKRPEQIQAIHTLLGKGTLWKGDIQSGQNSLRIEGTVEGTIHSEGEVTVAPSGEVNGIIEAKHLIVTGKVLGTFRIQECLEIHGTGYVEGDVEVGSLVVDEGGTLQGTCTRRGVEKLAAEKVEDKDKEKERDRDRDGERDREAPFVPFPTPPALPPSTLGPQVAAFAGANRGDDATPDRHVFNLANNVPPLPAAGEHAYSKAKL
jgi:cytoskeletal protein CcmA (bactofilin family)